MKVVILAGGFGTRLEEETVVTPKPLVTIGEYPILWHIMKHYSAHGFFEFIVCLGYKGYKIKEYFHNYFLHHSDVTFDFCHGQNKMHVHNMNAEPWRVTLFDTGIGTQTGGRIKRIAPYIEDDEFMLTYGDGVSDVDIKALVDFHHGHDKLATITAVKPPGKFGMLIVDKQTPSQVPVLDFVEKPTGDGGWISGGFFVLNKAVIDYIDGDDTAWEHAPLQTLARQQQLMPFLHTGFWQCMDTIRHKRELEKLWDSGNPPWKTW